MRFQNGCNKVAIELWVVQFWFEIILVISNRTRTGRSFYFEIVRILLDHGTFQYLNSYSISIILYPTSGTHVVKVMRSAI